jgi:tRNA (mo5U34)-methyltransferase
MPSSDAARSFVDGSEFVWHQRFELAPGVFTPGATDSEWLISEAGVPADLSGLSVLDIGTANGAMAFIAERRGARRTVAIDIVDAATFGFNATAELLGSDVEYLTGSVYELESVLGERFDLVFFFGVLYHLRHPLLALDQVRAVTGGQLYLETAVVDHEPDVAAEAPLARFYRGAELGDDGSNWFAPSVACLLEWCASCGLDAELVRTVPDPAERAIVRARPTDGPPEWQTLTYERPLRVGVVTEPDLARELEDVRAQLAAVRNSRLLRLTAPLRRVWYRLHSRRA